MGHSKQGHLIATLRPDFDPTQLENELTPEEIQLLVLIDGKTTASGLAMLAHQSHESVREHLYSLSTKGVVDLRERHSSLSPEQSHLVDLDLPGHSDQELRSKEEYGYSRSSGYDSKENAFEYQDFPDVAPRPGDFSYDNFYEAENSPTGYQSRPQSARAPQAPPAPGYRPSSSSSAPYTVRPVSSQPGPSPSGPPSRGSYSVAPEEQSPPPWVTYETSQESEVAPKHQSREDGFDIPSTTVPEPLSGAEHRVENNRGSFSGHYDPMGRGMFSRSSVSGEQVEHTQRSQASAEVDRLSTGIFKSSADRTTQHGFPNIDIISKLVPPEDLSEQQHNKGKSGRRSSLETPSPLAQEALIPVESVGDSPFSTSPPTPHAGEIYPPRQYPLGSTDDDTAPELPQLSNPNTTEPETFDLGPYEEHIQLGGTSEHANTIEDLPSQSGSAVMPAARGEQFSLFDETEESADKLPRQARSYSFADINQTPSGQHATSNTAPSGNDWPSIDKPSLSSASYTPRPETTKLKTQDPMDAAPGLVGTHSSSNSLETRMFSASTLQQLKTPESLLEPLEEKNKASSSGIHASQPQASAHRSSSSFEMQQAVNTQEHRAPRSRSESNPGTVRFSPDDIPFSLSREQLDAAANASGQYQAYRSPSSVYLRPPGSSASQQVNVAPLRYSQEQLSTTQNRASQSELAVPRPDLPKHSPELYSQPALTPLPPSYISNDRSTRNFQAPEAKSHKTTRMLSLLEEEESPLSSHSQPSISAEPLRAPTPSSHKTAAYSNESFSQSEALSSSSVAPHTSVDPPAEDDDESGDFEGMPDEDFLQAMMGENINAHLSLDVTKHAAQVMTAFARVTTSFQLYDPRNDAVRDALLSLYTTLTSFLNNYEMLPLSVEPWEFIYEDDVVYRNREREHSLAFKFFRDGVRGLTFRKGVPWSELAQFLKILGMRYGGVHMFEDDIVTLLWKANFSFIETIAVEGFNADEEQDQDEYTEGLFDKATGDSEGQAMAWAPVVPLHEEGTQQWVRHLTPEPFQYQPISDSIKERLRGENDLTQLALRVEQLINYIEAECCHPENAMPTGPLKHLLMEYRDYLITDGMLRELYALLQRLVGWQDLSNPQRARRLTMLAQEVFDSFQEPRVLRRLLDSAKLSEDKKSIDPLVFKILKMVPHDHIPRLFVLLEEDGHSNLKASLRLVLVELSNKDPEPFIKRINRASPEYLQELLVCLHQIADPVALDALVAQIGHTSLEIQATVLKLVDDLIKKENQSMAVRQVINHLMGSVDSKVRRRAYRLIELSGDGRWAASLLRQLEQATDLDQEEMMLLARLAGHINPDAAQPILLELSAPPGRFSMERAQRKLQREAAIAGLAIIGNEESEQMIRQVLQKMPDEMREHCVAAMREIRRNARGEGLPFSSDALTQLSLHSLDELPSFQSEDDDEQAESQLELGSAQSNMPDLGGYSGAQEVDIQQIQQQMLQALQHAGASNDNNFTAQVREAGREFVMLFHMLVKTSKLYDPSNKIFDQPLKDFAALIDRLLDLLGEISLIGIDGQFYLNDVRVRLNRESAEVAAELYDDLDRIGVGGLTFTLSFQPEEIRSFVHILAGLDDEDDQATSVDEINQRLQRAGLEQQVELEGRLSFRIGDEEQNKVGAARSMLQSYARASQATDALWDALSKGRTPNPLPIRRASNDFVDALKGDNENPLEIMSLGDPSNPFAAHILNVSIYTLMLGIQLEFSSSQLADLSMAAFFHDVGYAIPAEQVSAENATSMELPHQSTGLRFLLKQRGFHDSKIKRLLTVYEHHADAIPDTGNPIPHLFSRLIRVVDLYDLLTAPVLSTDQALSPAKALEYLWNARHKHLDGDLVQLFINIMGRFPPGTLVEFQDGSWAVSMGYDGNPAHFKRPKVMMVRTPQGQATEGPVVDLTSADQQHMQITRIQKPQPDIDPKKIMARALKHRIQLEKHVYS